jgi:hypothetical protein
MKLIFSLFLVLLVSSQLSSTRHADDDENSSDEFFDVAEKYFEMENDATNLEDFDVVDEDVKIEKERRSVLNMLNKCITDKDCKPQEYCDHHGINPIGSCKQGHETNHSCVFDRHCRSKICHLLKCVNKKPVKDGPCTENHHEECLPTQYCSHQSKAYQCKDRKCSGLCGKDAHCLSNDCSVFKCKKPKEGCK